MLFPDPKSTHVACIGPQLGAGNCTLRITYGRMGKQRTHRAVVRISSEIPKKIIASPSCAKRDKVHRYYSPQWLYLVVASSPMGRVRAVGRMRAICL